MAVSGLARSRHLKSWEAAVYRFLRFVAVFALALTASLPASAHSRFFFGFGFPLFFPAYYDYPPHYYYPPPAYYYPPPVYYAPAPAAYVAPAPTVNCRRFQGDGTDDDTGQPFFGIACMQADGRWHIVGN
jgi:hypothetical protein